MSNGQSSSGGIGGGLIPDDGFLSGSLLEEAVLLGALPGLTDVIGAGGSQAPSGSGFPDPSLVGLQSPSPLQPPAFPVIPISGGAGSSAGSSGSSPAQFNSLLSDALTGATQGSLVGNPGVGNFPLSSASAPGSSNATAPGLGFTVKAEGTVTINSNSDFDGDPLDLSDDALIYAGDGFTINGNPVLPVQLDEFGQPVLDNSGRPLLVDNAVAVSADYSIFNANNNTYGNLVPPQIVEEQIVEVPDFNTLKTDTLAAQIPDGTVPISFNPYQNPLNNATDWANHFPPGGTAEQPTVVKVTGWGLNVPGGVTIENTIIELANGYLNFNGNGHQLNNVTFVTHNGGMNLGNIQGTDVTLLSSQGINMNGGARLGGQSLIATGDNQSIQFNGATETTDPTDFLTVISQRDITFNSSANTRGSFLSRGNFSINSTSTIYGSIETKGNVVFNARATVIGIAPTGPSNTAPTDLALSNTTLPENGAANSVVGQLTTTDPDAGDTFTYTLIPGTGDTDNAAFSIVNDQLQFNASPDFETQDSYAIRVQSTDQGGLSVEKVFTVNITDVNEQPTQIALSQSAVEENSATGTVVGQLSSLDPDQGDSHTYELVDDAGGRFQIVGDQLQVADGTLIDFETATEYSLTLRSTDAGGLSTTQGLTIQVLDVDDDLQITAALLQDTGATNTDGITADGTIQGTINYPDNVASLKAGLDNTLPIDYEDITPLIQADGSFTLDEAQLSSILGVPLTDGDHILYLQAVDAQGNSTDIVELAFTLDRTRPTVDLLTPLVAGEHSPTARLLGDAQDSVAGVDQIRYDLNGQGFVDITADSTGAFDALLAQAGLAAGAHQLTVEVTDFAGNVTQTQLDFQVNPDLLVGPTASQGWVARSGDAVVLGEQNSFVSEASLAVELGQDTGSRTLSFDLNAVFDGTDAESLPDQVLVYLVDANDPSQTLLDQGVDGTPVFALGEQGAEFQAGLVRFNGSTVEIDVTSVTATQGLLVFQLINGDSDTGSVIQVSNLTNEVDESGVASPVFPMRRDVAQAGATLDLGGLTTSTDLDVVLSKVSLDTDTGRYVADLQIENTGAAIGRQVAVVFDSLPDGITLLNASGTDSNGNPYINLNLAIRPGGLLEGGISDAVQVVFDNPNLLNLDLQPQVLVGGVNQAPVLEAITVPQLMPGEVLKLPLQATDPDGDPITYSLRSEGALPIGILRGDGTLEFRPAPDQIGTYTFTIVASDGALETTQEVTLEVVADPITTTRISGVIANVDQQPLAGVRVEIAGVEGTTAADGSFTLEFVGDLPGDTLKIYPDDINTATEVYPFIAEKLPLVLGHDPYGGVNNVIDRPIYLPVLDIANGQVIDPTQDTTVTTATIPGAAVTVAAGSLLDQQGNPFDGVLSITEVPAEFTPAALPPNLSPDLVVTIQPGEMVFDTPAPLSLPNLAGFEPGELMDLWSINPETGDFDNVGVGQVSADGTVVETIEGGIRSSSWHFFANRLENPGEDARNRDPRCQGATHSEGITSSVETYSGALIETHDLVSYESLGEKRGITLTYDSLRADARPIIHFGYSNVQGGAGRHLIAKLSVSNGAFSYEIPGYQGNEFGLTGGEHIWTIPKNGDIDAALQVDLRSLESGIYTYDLMSGLRQFNRQVFAGSSAASQGQIYHINSINSVFGSGWGISGLHELIESPTGSLLLIDGDGNELVFDAPTIPGDAYQSPPGDFSTVVRLDDGTFQRTMKDQTIYRFNDQNHLVSMTDRNGNVTEYRYNTNAQISKIIDPVGLETTFTYTGNRVTQITDPAGRVTELDYDADGNLTNITDPDGESRTWEYDADHRMVGEVDKRGNQEKAYYDFSGRITKGIRKDGSVVQVAPVSVQGLYRPDATINPLAAPEVFTLGEVESSYADGNGNVTISSLDQAGQIVTQLDGEGILPAVERNANNLISQSTDSRNHTTNYTYDDQGNLIRQSETIQEITPLDSLFANPVYRTSTSQNLVAFGDLNGDGIQDIIAGSRANGSGLFDPLSVLLGNGDGSFSTPITTTFNATVSEIEVADIDGDGQADLVISNTQSQQHYLSILLGQGNGQFLSQQDIQLEERPESISIGDLDNDNNLDVVLVNQITENTGGGYGAEIVAFQSAALASSTTFDQGFSILFGEGDGSFAERINYASGTSISSLTLGDLNNDGLLDIIANKVEAEPLIAASAFTANALSTNSTPANPVANGTSSFLIHLNQGNQDFEVSILDSGELNSSLRLGDFNSDGNLDLVAAYSDDSGQQRLSSWLGQGNGTFNSPVDIALTGSVNEIYLSDHNQDGQLDLIVTNRSRLSIFKGEGNGEFNLLSAYQPKTGFLSNLFQDLNGDKRLDMVTGDGSQNISVQVGQVNGDLTEKRRFTELDVGAKANGITTGDYNLDGFIDIAVADRGPFNGQPGVSILFGTASNGYEEAVHSTLQRFSYWQNEAITSVDLNGDGFLDILSTYSNSSFPDNPGSLQVQYGRGDGTFRTKGYTVGANPVDIKVVDFDLDGQLDIITANREGNSVSVLLLNTDESVKTSTDFAVSESNTLNSPNSIALADFDNDGQVDIVTANVESSSVSVLFNNGGTIEAITTFVVNNAPTSMVVGDLNQDGLLDLVAANEENNTLSILLNTGTAPSRDLTFSSGLLATGTRPIEVLLEDINRDGQLDLAVANADNGSVSVYLGDGTGNFADETTFGIGSRQSATSRPSAIALSDLDGNGTLDLIVADEPQGRIFTGLQSRTVQLVEVSKTYTYDSTFNQLTSVRDELGHQILYDIDSTNGNILSITQVIDDVGGDDDLITSYTYTAQGLIDLETDPLGRITDYDYNALGLVTQITLAKDTPDQAIVQYEYDTAGNQIAIIDENSNRTEFEYDALNRLVRVTESDPDGPGLLASPVTSFGYDATGNLSSITDARGHISQYEYDEKDRLLSSTDALNGITQYEYDSHGNLITATDELGRITQYLYDSRNRQIGMINPEGGKTFYEYDANDNLTTYIDALGNRTKYVFDVRNRLVDTIDALGQFATNIYDAADNLVTTIDENGHQTSFQYDELYRLEQTTDAIGGITSLQYDKASNVIAATDELGRTTQFDYDNRDRLTQITDPLNGMTMFAYDDVGNLLSVTDELNRTTTYEYDALNRRVSVSDPLTHTTSFSYDAVDNLVSVTDALGRTTQYEYDALNRETTRINALGDTHSYTYDAVDNVIAVTDELGRTTTFTYDDRDLRASFTDPLGHATTTEYDEVGNVTAIIDPLGHITRYSYDVLYRQTSETDAIGQITTFAYDPVGNLLRITDPENNSTSYTYDDLNRRITDTNELGDTRSYLYDAVDNQIGMTDRNSRQIEYLYDDLDRQTEEIWLDTAGNPIRTFSYTYDAADQLTAVRDPDSAYTYTYDLAGRLITVDNAGTPGVPNVLLTYTYDAVNNMLTVTDTIEGQVSGLEEYTYDALDRVTRLTQSGNGVAEKRVDFAYDVASQMTGSTRYADLAATQLVAQSDYTFDLAGRLTNLTHSRDSVVIADYRWDYDAANRIIRFTSPDGTSDYNYDDRNQITGSDHSYQDNEAYSYDDNGNRTNVGYETGDNNRLLSDGTYTYTYDGEGNRITRTEIATGEVTEYIWDYRNRLTGVVTKDSVGNVIQDVEYGYDVYDRRVEKTVDPDGDGPESEQTERFVYDGDHITLVFDENGEQTHRYLHGPQIDQVLAEEIANGEVRWALADNQGTIRDVIDSDGNVLNHITYDSFGQITSETNPDIDFRFSYTGREFDEETGQNYYRARYYDASVGQFISEDTIGFSAGDANLYRYVFNSPLIFIDPSGNSFYSFLNSADQFFAGFADSVTLGASTKLREAVYGDIATRNHQGALFSGGNIVGDIATTPFGGPAVKGPKALQRAAKLYSRASDAKDLLEKAHSTSKLLTGCGDIGDVITVVGGLASRRGRGRNNANDGFDFTSNANRSGQKNEVFRALREGEDPSKGLRARSPGANTEVGSHVMGKKQSDLISTTKDQSKAEGLFNSGNGVVAIDLDKVPAEVIDASEGVGKGRVFSRTKSHQEVLVRDTGGPNPPIPPAAIRIIQSKK